MIISTSIEPETGLEIPVACLTMPGNTHDGNYFIHLKEQIKWQHPYFKTSIDIGDCGFDIEEDYNYVRAEGSIPIFDYNIRSEKLTQDALYKRGYNQDGWSYAPCKALCRPNGYDKEHKRLSFVCAKQCQRTSSAVPEPISNCSYLNTPLGFATHKSISENPRLLCEIPRGTKRWKKIHNLRPASERTNSTTKSDLDILAHPRVLGLQRTSILAQMACIVTCLKRFLDFVVRITLTLRKFRITGRLKFLKELELKKTPRWLINIIQRK